MFMIWNCVSFIFTRKPFLRKHENSMDNELLDQSLSEDFSFFLKNYSFVSEVNIFIGSIYSCMQFLVIILVGGPMF